MSIDHVSNATTSDSNPILKAALDLVAKGVQITLCNGKAPIDSNWQARFHNEASVRAAFDANPNLNVGVVLGSGTGMTDFEGDSEESEEEFLELFDGVEPRTWKFRSTRGLHRFFKYDSRLASLNKSVAKWNEVEIRGCNERASQSVVPPSVSDGFERAWLVSPADCELASIPESVIRKLVPPTPSETIVGKKGKPGDDYNQRGPTWAEILTPLGWTHAGNNGDKTDYWRRPGKSSSVSATTGHLRTDEGHELLYVFSSNANPFMAGKAYSKFAAYTFVNHGGDFAAAAKALASEGYGSPTQKNSGPSAATRLIDMVTDDNSVDLFHTPDGDAFATVPYDGHRETLRLNSARFKHYLSHRFYGDCGSAASSKAISDAINVFSGMATFDGSELEVNLRVAAHEGSIYVDRGCPSWDAIEVSSSGFKLVSDPPVKFWRPKGMLGLPVPTPGGSIDDLRSVVRLSDDSFLLLAGVLLSYFRASGPYPITILTGEHGTAKSTTADVMRRLIDPRTVQRQGDPKNVEDLMVMARNNWIASYDNLSALPQWLSDGLCRLSTGGGMSTREHYTNGEEFVINAQRPVIINSIVDVATRPDLLDRAVVIELEPIPENERRDETEFWGEFDSKRPQILGSLFEAVSCALRRLPEIKRANKPRMADFAKWVTAAEPSLKVPDGKFISVYQGNLHEASGALLDSVVAQAVIKLVDTALAWEGSPTQLYTTLSAKVGGQQELWPGSAAKLTGELLRIAPVLRKVGYRYENRRASGRRLVRLEKSAAV